MRLCSILLISLLSTQTPAVGGFGTPTPVELVTISLPITVDQSSLDSCKFTKDTSTRESSYVCTIDNPTPIEHPLTKTDQFKFEDTMALPERNRFRGEADAKLEVVATPNAIRLVMRVVVKREYRGMDLPVGFESKPEMLETAQRLLARQPEARVTGTLVLQYVK